MSRTVTGYMVQALKHLGVNRVFGMVADSLNGSTGSALARVNNAEQVPRENARRTRFWVRSVVPRRAVLAGAAALLASPAFARPILGMVRPAGIRVTVSQGARARVHTFSFDGAPVRDSLHIIELLDRLIVVSVNAQAIASYDVDQWSRVLDKPVARQYATSPTGDRLDGERSNFGRTVTLDRAQAGIEIISGEPIEVRCVSTADGERVMFGLPRDRILITGDIVVNESPDRGYPDQTAERRAALALCQGLPYTRILPARGRPGGRELYETMRHHIDGSLPA